ncbi:MAG: alkaline phosphatase [Ignisphaera sp.]
MSVGVVTTTRVTHATPAVFTAHAPHRDMEQEIVLQQIALEVDAILGGGRRFYTSELVSEARRRGYTVVFNRSSPLRVDSAKTRRLLGLFADSHIPYVLDRDSETPSLVEMTAKAIEILDKNPCGFFLMIEGGRIDHAAHANDIASVIAETKEFDDVVGFVTLYARSRGDTLVIVTSDHETGGLTIGLGVEIPTNIRYVLSVKASVEKIANEVRGRSAQEVKTIIYRYIRCKYIRFRGIRNPNQPKSRR